MNAAVKAVYKKKKPSAQDLVDDVSKPANKSPVKNEKKAKVPTVKITVKKRLIGQVPEEHSFYIKDGTKVQSIMQLVNNLEHMRDEVFSHHVNEMNNDFANWIEHVFDEKNLASDLRKVMDRTEHRVKIMRHMLDQMGVK